VEIVGFDISGFVYLTALVHFWFTSTAYAHCFRECCNCRAIYSYILYTTGAL